MPKSYPATAREAILGFHFADRMKAELLLASRLLQTAMHLDGPQGEGARRLLLEFFRGLNQDLALGQSLLSNADLTRVQTMFLGLQGMVAEGMLPDIQSHLTWMITIMTTYAQRAMEFLYKEKLL